MPARKSAKKAAKRAAKAGPAHAGSGSNNPDSKPEIKQVIPSPNRSSRNGAAITMIVMHCTEGSLAGTIATFRDGSSSGRQVSAHYVIDRNGDIYQMVEDGHRANHCRGANSNSIGIEHVATQVQALTAAQSAASARLVRWLLQQYDIPSTRVFGHDFAPGYSGGGTSCPDALFGAHTQQAVQDWVNANVVSAALAPLLAAPAPPPAGSQLTVTASALNVRLTPSLQGRIVGSLPRGESVAWLDVSPDHYWAKVQNPILTGWASRRFLVPTPDAAPAGPLDLIKHIAATSAIARYNWPGRGVAPPGYVKGMALVYARLYCKLKAGDAATVEMARANSGDGSRDALEHYKHQFGAAGMDNESSGISTLRHLVVLLIGLGMRESSGRHCEGRDISAGNMAGSTAEAGLFQTSYNAASAHPLLPVIFQQYEQAYQTDPETGFMGVFGEGVTCRGQDWRNFGSGSGKSFQELSKKSPAFAAEFCALGLRHLRRHWGPINNRAAEIRPEANQLLMRVEQTVESQGLTSV
jgi:hypothetical protein